ncbi:MAG: glucose-1-phosphate cytidylyltransferase [Clostridia bacterium]|nr:glucose-1-phosphate cytidylyltransferase [Clostridia bacterium]
MKVVILAGGFGTRISEESHLRPKPMIEIGGMPILWHIMKYYASFGHHDFVICAGYRQSVIKDWFSDYYINHSDATFDFVTKEKVTVHSTCSEPWRVTVVDTGLETMTGGRIKRVRRYIGDEPFFLTYGDGVADVDLAAEAAFHLAHGKLATVMAVKPDSRFGVLDIREDRVCAFREKSEVDAGWINGGFMILSPRVIDYIDGDATVFERAPLERLCAEGELMAFRHHGFWQCMDTMRDKEHLEKLWAADKAPWRRWEG